uniref:SEC7 domain-containing protein n=2 Tax=Caenorhabditis japonica TaxID=281687 RepID=A0A8R1I1G7_CAEJA
MFQGEGLSKSAIGEILGDNRPFALETLDLFTREHRLHNVPIVPALRQYLFSFRLPGESQKIDRILIKFAEIYVEQNPDYGSADQAHTVAYSCIMVNTLLHNPNVKDKPSLEKYIEMNEDLLATGSITVEQLTEVFQSVSVTQFKIPDEVAATGKGSVDDILLHAEREGWLFNKAVILF